MKNRIKRLSTFMLVLCTSMAIIHGTSRHVSAIPCWQQPDPPPDCDYVPPPDDSPPNQDPEYDDNDQDHDTLRDSYENELLQRFAPRIWLHSSENRWPVNVEWLLNTSTLRYAHAGCSDDEILPWGGVSVNNLISQSHQDKKGPLTLPPWDVCEHYGPQHRSNRHVGTGTDTFFLQFPDWAHEGIETPGNWELYGHVYPATGGRIVIQFWQLYAFNDSFASFNHEGDWEYTAVIINEEEVPVEVIFSRHGRSVSVSPDDVEWVGDHHVTFSAKGGHAQYHARRSNGECAGDGLAEQVQGFADDCNQGLAWDTWENSFGSVINVGEKSRPLNGQNWIQYSGLWGEIGAIAEVSGITSGPRGPAYKSSWNGRRSRSISTPFSDGPMPAAEPTSTDILF